MNNTEKRELLSAYVNGELGRTQREFVEGHLEDCVDCRAALADFTWVRHRLIASRTESVATDIKEVTMATIAAPRPIKVPVGRLARPVLLLLSGTGPGARIAEAYDVLAGLESYRMSGTTISSMNSQTAEVSFEWDFAAPESYRGTISGNGETQGFILIGRDQYSRISAN
jgi:predicted anti-sigma-YlaC factor YlaD